MFGSFRDPSHVRRLVIPAPTLRYPTAKCRAYFAILHRRNRTISPACCRGTAGTWTAQKRRSRWTARYLLLSLLHPVRRYISGRTPPVHGTLSPKTRAPRAPESNEPQKTTTNSDPTIIPKGLSVTSQTQQYEIHQSVKLSKFVLVVRPVSFVLVFCFSFSSGTTHSFTVRKP